jgi:hypothetical protein
VSSVIFVLLHTSSKRSLMKKLLLIFSLLLVSFSVSAQTTYGVADFSRTDAWPKDGLVDYWDLNNVQVSGDMLNGLGDMETGAVGGGCTYCPSGSCICNGTSLMEQESSLIYKNNYAIKMTSGATGVTMAMFSFVAVPGTAYQITINYKGTDATEDFSLQLVGDDALYYNFATDAWQAGNTSRTVSTLATTWTSVSSYVLNDTVARTVSVRLINNTASKVFYLDNLIVQALGTAGVTGMKNNMVQTVTGNVAFGQNTSGVTRVNQGPAGNYGGTFDGVDSSVSTPDNAVYEPVTYGYNFSWGCRNILPSSTTGTRTHINKDSAGNTSFSVYHSGTNVTCMISDDGSVAGGHVSSLNNPGLTANLLSSNLCTYKGIADGSSVAYNYLDGDSATSSAFDFPIYNGTARLTVGSDSSLTSNELAGSIGQCALWGRTLSAKDAAKWISPHFPAPTMTNGFYPTACTHTAPEATCGYDKCRPGTPNACQVTGTGTQAVFAGNTELAPNNSFETFTGTDAAPTITGWTATGTGQVVSMYRPAAKHGSVAVRLKVPTDTATLSSPCTTVVSSTAYYAAYYVIITKGNPTARMSIDQYSDAGCTVLVTTKNIDTTTTKVTGDTFTTGVGTIRVIIRLVPSSPVVIGSDVVFDNVSLKALPYATPWFHNSGLGTTTSTSKTYTVNNPLAEQRPDGVYAYTNGFCFGTWLYTDYGGSDTVDRFLATGHNSATNTWLLEKYGVVFSSFRIADNAGDVKRSGLASTDVNFSPNSWKYLAGCTNNAGTLTFKWFNTSNSTWYTGSSGGVGTGVLSTAGTPSYLGMFSTGVGQIDGYIYNFVLGPYNAINPLLGFNNRPRNRPY